MAPITEALQLEVSIIEAMLGRNRASHGRTLYYKRMRMVLQCCRKGTLLEFQARLKQYLERREKQSQEWTIGQVDKEEVYLRTTLSTTFPELISRIEHAGKALFVEIGRAFFLPFCTVAAAALARIRVLVQQLGQEGIMKMGILHEKLPLYVEQQDEQEHEQEIETKHLEALTKSLGLSWGNLTGVNGASTNNKNDKSFNTSIDKVDRDDGSGDAETEMPSVEAPEEDLGRHVGMDSSKPVVGDDQPAIIDHNRDILKETMKASKKKKKRKLEAEGETKKKTKKKKKKKKDVFDDIFG